MCNCVYAKESLKEQCHGNCGFHYLQFCMCKRKFKGTVPWDVWLQVFHESVSPKPMRVISNFFLLAEIFAAQGAPPVSLLTPGANLPPVSLIPVANCSVSLIPVANCHWFHWHWQKSWHWQQIWHWRKIWHRRQICCRCHWWQIYNCSAQTVTRIGLLEEIPRSGVQNPCLS